MDPNALSTKVVATSADVNPNSNSGLNATIADIKFITEDLFFLKVVPDAGVLPYLPGQSLALGLPGCSPRAAHVPPDPSELHPDKMIKRAYSLASSPDESRYYEFFIALVHQGALTPRFHCLEAGSRMFAATKPVGTFTLEGVPEGSDLIFVSTGTGIAPFISMLRTKSTIKRFRSFALLHGVRHSVDLAYDGELKRFQQAHANFHYIPVVSRDADFPGTRGHVQAALFSQEFFDRTFDRSETKTENLALDPARHHVFLCGNPAMIADVTSRLSDLGYRAFSKKDPSGSLHVESYW